MILTEGGNVFKDDKGVPQTRRILRNEVPGTLNFLERITGLNLTDNTLGSTGVVDSSGDIDLAIDAATISRDSVRQVLTHWLQQQGIPNDQILNGKGFNGGWIKPGGEAGEVNFKCPIEGDIKRGFAQVDFMFITNMKWSKWLLGAMPAGSKYKGVDRFILLNSVGKPLNIKLDGKRGAMDRTTDELVTDDPDQLAHILLGPGHTAKEHLNSVESVVAALRNDPQRDQKLADAVANFKSRGLELPVQEASAHPTEWFKHLSTKLK